MTHSYVPGRGYTVRDARGRILGHSLNVAQRDALLANKHAGVIPSHVLPIFSA